MAKPPKLPKMQKNLPGTAKKPQSANFGKKPVGGGKMGSTSTKKGGVC